jgi:hypothetical protein
MNDRLLTLQDFKQAFSDLSDAAWALLLQSGKLDDFLACVPGPELPVRFAPAPVVVSPLN